MSSDIVIAGLVAATTFAPLVIMLVLVGRDGRARHASAAATASVVTYAASAEVLRLLDVRFPTTDRASTPQLFGIAFVLTALAILAFARLGGTRRELPWVDLIDASSPLRIAFIIVVVTVCNIKNQTVLAVAIGGASSPLDSVVYGFVAASTVLALLAAGWLLRDRRTLLRAVHDWMQRHQTSIAVVTFAAVGALLLAAG